MSGAIFRTLGRFEKPEIFAASAGESTEFHPGHSAKFATSLAARNWDQSSRRTGGKLAENLRTKATRWACWIYHGSKYFAIIYNKYLKNVYQHIMDVMPCHAFFCVVFGWSFHQPRINVLQSLSIVVADLWSRRLKEFHEFQANDGCPVDLKDAITEVWGLPSEKTNIAMENHHF